MKKTITATISSLLSISALANTNTIPSIGIVVPLEHQAMTEIVDGFKQELANKYHHPVNVIVKNAEHDPMLERSIIKQFQAENITIIEPIGEDAFELTLASTQTQPVIGIAAEFSDQQRESLSNKSITNVDDELSSRDQLNFIRLALPSVKKISIIHSADDKVYTEVNAFKIAANQQHIAVQDLTVEETSDLYTISQHIAPDSQAIFILKDHPIVSGIATLAKQAESMKIPLIASDDGSVQGGAVFALGVREKEIGIKAADLTAKALSGQAISSMPMAKLTHYHIFLNPIHAEKQGINVKHLRKMAAQAGYDVIAMNTK
ncbi:MAG: hypothetical protein A3F67_08230 [Verrucomicrobia bacterium RIFCSPHIGHO2_12_FULL_41_10]|nr:MAG: hypothetical protein A3F67_08230 [Verrucomicrobia bacterium RIFCSPHIGHO2_12_FULL_41_10]